MIVLRKNVDTHTLAKIPGVWKKEEKTIKPGNSETSHGS